MAICNTIEAIVKEGVIYPADPKKIPKEGRPLKSFMEILYSLICYQSICNLISPY